MTPPESALLAAAVPVKRRDGRTEILLVRTKGDRYWTLPKGHRERSETLGHTAEREAREEAGIVGTREPEPLGTFIDPGKVRPTEVVAFLLHVTEEGLARPEGDAARKASWFGVDEALSRLGEGERPPGFAAEMERILRAAVERVEGGPPRRAS